jgi:hypothetical protein
MGELKEQEKQRKGRSVRENKKGKKKQNNFSSYVVLERGASSEKEVDSLNSMKCS